jgi:hypothetical protein
LKIVFRDSLLQGPPEEKSPQLFTPKFGEKNAGTQSFQDCIIKGSVRWESMTADLDTVSESAIFMDDVSRLCGIGEKRVRLYKK